ncbi:MAG: tetratricopeptide repeat protein [Xenococcaceae cyanobacterium MO_167.B52]|nr:tetratricopeptide repeat protein [Xenococcaceae cyanobacterium MO_167.B52]
MLQEDFATQTIKEYFAQGQWSEVIEVCTQVLTREPQRTELYLFLAKAYSQQGRVGQAIAVYRQILEQNQNSPDIYGELGLLYTKQQDLVQAAWCYQKALALKPTWAELHYNLAIILHQLGDWSKAIDSYRQTLKLKPSHAAAYFNLGLLYDRRQETEMAIASYQRAIELKPDYLTAYSNLGSVLAKDQQYKSAIEVFKQGLKLDPTWGTLHNNLGQVYLFDQQPEKALASFEYAITVEPNMALAHYNLGNLWQQQKNYPKSLECFEEVIKLEPNNIVAQSSCAAILLKIGEIKSAIKYLRNAIFLQPTFVAAYYHRVKQLEPKDTLEQAKLSCARFLEALFKETDEAQVCEHLWQTYFYLGEVLFEYGGAEQAEVYYRQALDIKPDEVNLYLRLGNCLAKQKRFDGAIAAYQMGLTIQPNHSQLCFQLGKVLQKQKNSSSAVSYYETVLKQDLTIGGGNWQSLPTLFPSSEHLSNLPTTLYHHTQDWIRDCKLKDFNYIEVTWSGTTPQSKGSLFRQPEPIVIKDNASSSTTECGGINCNHCLSDLLTYFQPIQIGQNAYQCSFEAAPPITAPLPFVVTIPHGRTWIVPQTNSWMVCKAIAVITPDNCLLGDLSRYYPWLLPGCSQPHKVNHTLLNVDKISPVKKLAGRVAVLSGLSGDVYYHWLFDIIPRIELIRLSGIKLESIDWFVVNSIEKPFQKETLRWLGIPDSKIICSDQISHIQGEQLIVPSFPGYFNWVPWGTIKFLRETFLSRINLKQYQSPEKIYISRRKARARHIINETKVVALLAKYGFKTVFLEEMSMVEQIILFANAKFIVAPHGSGLSNLVFCAPGTTVVELFSPRYLRTHYWILSQQLQLKHYYSVGDSFDCPSLLNLMYQNSLTDDILVNLSSLELIMEVAGVTN